MKPSDKKHSNDVYLAKWLNNELTDVDLKNYVSEKDFNTYVKIRDGLQYFEAPKFDGEQLQKSIKNKFTKQKVKIVKLNRKWFFAAAASIAIIFSISLYINSLKTTYKTSFGEQKTAYLLDGSEVQLNAKSNLSYQKNTWLKKREVKLNGEAFFKVKKGKNFTVQTKNGTVTVLGTHFNVNSQPNFFSVMCYEGKVMVIQKSDTIYLTKGEAYQNNQIATEKWNFSGNFPTWQNGEINFKSTPLKIVILSLEKQFGIEIIYKNINGNRLFTGSFNNNDLQTALKSIFIPMQIDYHLENKKVFLSEK